MTIDRLEALNQRVQTIQRLLAIGEMRGMVGVRQILQFFQADQFLDMNPPLAHDVGRGDIVRDTISPGTQGASAIKSAKASPERDMNLLHQITTEIGISLVSASQPLQCRSVRLGYFGIKVVLRRSLRLSSGNGFDGAHT